MNNKRQSLPSSVTGNTLTAGDLTVAANGALKHAVAKFQWTNALVAALGAVTTGNLKVCTLPAKTLVKKVTVVITGQAAGLTACTVSVGRTGTAYIDYVVAASAKAAANTIYGDAIAEIGTGLADTAGSFPSLASTTDVYVQFLSSVENLSNITGSSGDIYIEYVVLP